MSKQLFTPYAAARVVNAALAEAGVEKTLPPQMFYNYTTARIRAGKAPLIEAVEKDGKVMIAEEALGAWLTKYLAKQGVEVEKA